MNALKPKKQVEKRPSRAIPGAVVGRPSSYRDEFAVRAYDFALLGATDSFIAEKLGVAESTYYLWLKDVSEFSESVTRGKAVADAQVAKALYQRALGYSHPEDDIRTLSVGGGQSEIVITPTVKHYPPDTAAATLWLKNRQPQIWRDKIDHELSGKDGGSIKHDVSLSADEAYLRMLGK